MQMSFVYLKLDKGQDSTEKLTIFKELILGLIRLGVDFHSREQLGFGAQYVLRSLKPSTHANNSRGSLHQLGGIIHGGIEHSLTNVSLGSSALASKGALDLLAWLSNQGYELSTFPSDVSSQITTPKANYPFGTALDAVRLDEDFAIGKFAHLKRPSAMLTLSRCWLWKTLNGRDPASARRHGNSFESRSQCHCRRIAAQHLRLQSTSYSTWVA
jgi:hypothetical protein